MGTTRVSRLAAITAVAIALGGCATTSGGPGGRQASINCHDPSLSPAERQICQDNKAFNETMLGGIATGAAAGAAVGALACWAAGENPLHCALAGALAGGIVGGLDGYVTAKQQEATRQRVRAIDLVTRDVQAENQSLERTVQAARQMTQESQQRLTSMNQALRDGKVQLEAVEAERARAERNRGQLETMIASLEERRSAYMSAQQKTNQDSPQFRQQIAQMEAQVGELKRQRDALNEALAVRTA